MYQWRQKTKKDGIAFYTFWTDTMDVYENHGHTDEQLDRWGSSSMRSAFQKAAFDFMELQHLDYASMICCDHLEVCHCALSMALLVLAWPAEEAAWLVAFTCLY